jgi:hypothetical protein
LNLQTKTKKKHLFAKFFAFFYARRVLTLEKQGKRGGKAPPRHPHTGEQSPQNYDDMNKTTNATEKPNEAQESVQNSQKKEKKRYEVLTSSTKPGVMRILVRIKIQKKRTREPCP